MDSQSNVKTKNSRVQLEASQAQSEVVPSTKKINNNSKSKQVKTKLSAADAAFLAAIAEKLGITEQDVIRKGVKLMKLYADVYDKPEGKLVVETDEYKQDIMIL